MKRVFIIAAVLIAALPMAQASTYLFTSSSGYPGASLFAYGSETGNGTSTLGGSLSSVVYNTTYGAGVQATTPYVTNTSFLVVDFSNPLAAHSTVEVLMTRVDSGYYIYGGNTAPTSSGISGLTVLASSTPSGGPFPPHTADVYFALGSTAYTYLVVTAASTCTLNLDLITNNVPEPGTFVMAGMALIALGVGLRKVSKR